MVKYCLALVVMSFVVTAVCGQDTQGFISIDCGNTNSFVDDSTKLTYTSDDQYIDTGVNANIASNYKSTISLVTLFSLRSFPSGDRNCYNLKPVERNSTYLIRVGFYHGNYDSHFSQQSKKPILFDLYIGISKWKTVNITDAGYFYMYEAVSVALGEVLYVCLVNTGQGTPFISLLEMRQMKSPFYPYVTETQFADLYGRGDVGGSKYTRYPNDKYDRIWYPVMIDEWTNISTSQKVNSDFAQSSSELPSAVLQTAVIPSKSAPNSSNLYFNWTQHDGLIPPIGFNLYFAEVKQLPVGGKREFNIYYNGQLFYDHVNPTYLTALTVYSVTPQNMPITLDTYSITLNVTSNSTEPAILNAFEIYSILSVDSKMVNPADNDAILAIKTEYKLNKGWTGDPCAPEKYPWVGVGCDYKGNSSKIISLNLSNSGLTGSVSSSLSRLQNLKILDLSNNSLNGTIPGFLGTMTSLQVLNLSGNSFSCPIPETLQKKSNSGLIFLTDNKCTAKTTKKAAIHVIGLVLTAVAVVILSILAFIVIQRRKTMPQVDMEEQKVTGSSSFVEVQLKTQKFTKTELEQITDNFMKQIGGGGFGGVFAGTLKDGTSVAVKKLSKASKQGPHEFLTEAQNLAMLHHKNLLSLVGYCEDQSCLALVYEYMSQGTLEDHIREKLEISAYGLAGNRGTLSWRERLRIALEAAKGLEYMHKGCRMPIAHRDVKSNNILLGENLEAKVSDLGLARAFHSKDEATFTMACGTYGYIDPEYFRTNMLSVKSDVYSFGIVLLEIITGLPPVIEQDCHLLQHISKKLQREDITSVIDGRLEEDYDVNSVWKVFYLAMSCTQKESAQRPTMSQVVAELKESLDLETHCVESHIVYGENVSIIGSLHSDTDATSHIRAASAYSVSHASPSGNWKNESAYMLGPSMR